MKIELDKAHSLYYGTDPDGIFRKVEDIFVGQGRWHSEFHVYVEWKKKRRYFRYTICLPATEMSGEVETYNPSELELVEVAKQTTISYEWKEVE